MSEKVFPARAVEIGKVSEFLAKSRVAGIELFASLEQGDKIHIWGDTTDIEFTVDSIQIGNLDVKQAKAGDVIGVKVSEPVRRGDRVLKILDKIYFLSIPCAKILLKST